jgi:hypothetical protein
MGTQAPAEIITREKVIEFLALIATGGKQSTLSREEGLEILLRIAGDKKLPSKIGLMRSKFTQQCSATN